MTASPAQVLAQLPDDQRGALLADLSADDRDALYRRWRGFWARPEQLAPDWPWRWWAMVTGRGFGKNRSGSEWVLDRAEAFAAHPGADHLCALMNATYSEVRQLQLGGISGIGKAAERRGHRLDMGKTSLEGQLLVWDEGWRSMAIEVHTADQPERARGRNIHTVWGDELAKWRHKVDPDGGTAFTNVDFGLRATCPPGLQPQGLVTTTPKPNKVVRDLVAGRWGPLALTRGSLLDNRANLDPSFVKAIIGTYGESRLGLQEIHGVVLDAVEGALWDALRLAATKIPVPAGGRPAVPPLHRIVVAIDPSGKKDGDEAGIIVAGVARTDGTTRFYVLADLSGQLRSDEWAKRAVDAYHHYGADVVVGEVNYGGDMVRGMIQMTDPNVPFDMVHATRGKAVRAQPVANLWAPSQQRGHLVGDFPELEEELCYWVPPEPGQRTDDSPNRLDAMVWAGHALMPDMARQMAEVAAPYGTIDGLGAAAGPYRQ